MERPTNLCRALLVAEEINDKGIQENIKDVLFFLLYRKERNRDKDHIMVLELDKNDLFLIRSINSYGEPFSFVWEDSKSWEKYNHYTTKESDMLKHFNLKIVGDNNYDKRKKWFELKQKSSFDSTIKQFGL